MGQESKTGGHFFSLFFTFLSKKIAFFLAFSASSGPFLGGTFLSIFYESRNRKMVKKWSKMALFGGFGKIDFFSIFSIKSDPPGGVRNMPKRPEKLIFFNKKPIHFFIHFLIKIGGHF